MIDEPVIGFIGVGLMGHGMAKNILAKGYRLVVMGHRNRAPVDDLVAQGAREAKTARALAEGCQIVHLCVSGSPQVEALMHGSDGILASERGGLIVIDCSTSNPVSTLSLGYAALYSEALAVARKAGLSVEQFHAVVGTSRMRCGFYDTFMKWTLEGDENAHRFTITNAHKDMRYVASMANEAGALSPIQAMVKNSFAAMEAAGQGDRYVPMLADFVAAQNALPPAAERSKR